jgi:predicted nucleotidyltransferase
MAPDATVAIVRRYLAALPAYGIHPVRAVVFGSWAKGTADEWSDIDVIVVAPEFDESRALALVEKLWLATEAADNRVEPIPCGQREWETDGSRPILEIARREGLEVAA